MKSQLYKELGKTIKGLRLKRGLKQQELADHIGLSRASMVNIEKGRHKPQIHILYDLSTVLGCTPTDLLPKRKSITPELPEELKTKLEEREEEFVAELISQANKGE